MNRTLDNIVSVVLTLATVLAAVVLLRREMLPNGAVAEAGPPQYLENWRDLVRDEPVWGNRDGSLQLVIFTDFECPFCRRFHEDVVSRFETAFSDSVGWRIVHFPLSIHKFAVPAARAYECGVRLGSGRSLVDVLYAKQDSFGLKSWASYAYESGIRDSAAFHNCLLDPRAAESVEIGNRVSQDLGIRGTPGVMLNGWLFPTPPSEVNLIRTARLLLANNNRLPDVVAPGP